MDGRKQNSTTNTGAYTAVPARKGTALTSCGILHMDATGCLSLYANTARPLRSYNCQRRTYQTKTGHVGVLRVLTTTAVCRDLVAFVLRAIALKNLQLQTVVLN